MFKKYLRKWLGIDTIEENAVHKIDYDRHYRDYKELREKNYNLWEINKALFYYLKLDIYRRERSSGRESKQFFFRKDVGLSPVVLDCVLNKMFDEFHSSTIVIEPMPKENKKKKGLMNISGIQL